MPTEQREDNTIDRSLGGVLEDYESKLLYRKRITRKIVNGYLATSRIWLGITAINSP